MAFLPSSLSGLAAWYDAADDASVTGETPVTQWDDKSGNAEHLTHASAGPDHIPASDVVRFSGTSSSGATGDFLNLPSITIRTVFAFIKSITPAGSTGNRYHALFGSSANNVALYLDIPGATTADYGIRPKGGLHKVSANAEEWVNQSSVDGTVKRPIPTDGVMIGVEYASGVTTNTYVGGSGGTAGNPVWRPNWDLAELIVYDRVLTADEKDLVEGYLAHKYSRTDLLPVDHAYKTNRPWTAVAADATQGQSATQPTISGPSVIAVDSGSHGQSASQPTVAGAGLTLTDVTEHRIYQRIAGEAVISLSGAYSGGDPAEVQARVMQGATPVVDWTTLTSLSISGGDWSGTLTVPEGGMYTVQARSRDGGGFVLAAQSGTNLWGVGDIFGVIGSSTPERWFTDGAGNSPDALMREYDGGWLAASTTGIAAVTFANQAITDSGVPVALMDYGVGGSHLSQWYLSGYSGFTAFTAALAAVGGEIAGVIVHIGSNDARSEAIANQAQHESRYRALIANLRTATGQAALPVFIMGCARAPSEPSTSDDYWGWARAAEHAVGQDTDVYLASTVVDLAMAGDNVHLATAAMGTSAARVARCVGAVLYGSGLEWRNPEVLGVARVDDAHTDVVLQHRGGDDFTPTSGITGFEISTDDFATTLAISAAARQSANSIRLTHATTSGAPVKVRYQWGTDPDVSAAVNDNAAATRPLGPMPSAILVSAACVVDGAGQGQAAGSPAMTGHSPIAADAAAQSQSASAATIAAHTGIAVDGGAQGHSATEPTVAAGGQISPAPLNHAQAASSPAIVAHTPVAADDAAQGQQSSVPAMAGHTPVAANGAGHGQAATSPTVQADSGVAVNDAAQAQAASEPAILGHSQVVVVAAAQDQSASSPVIAGHSPVTAASAAQGQVAAAPTVSARSPVAVDGAGQFQQASAPAVGSLSAIEVDDAAQAQVAGSPATTPHQPVPPSIDRWRFRAPQWTRWAA